jgi:hypothetical protein
MCNLDEKWRQVPSFKNYQVSNYGRVRPIRRQAMSKPHFDKDRYLQITLYVPGRRYHSKTVHSLVAEAFIGPRPEGLEINHKNGIKHDNTVANLEYLTSAENKRHAVRMNLGNKKRDYSNRNYKGSRNPNSKLNEWQVRVVRRIRSIPRPRPSIQFLAEKMEVSATTLSQAALGFTWKHLQKP